MSKLRALFEDKPLCFIVGDNVEINGDVAFTRHNFNEYVGDFTHWFYANNVKNLSITNCCHTSIRPPINNFKLWYLWFWHMTILRKDAVYLTGVLRK